MKSIGVRELRQHASRYLREVEHGETIEITDRGRPVALLVPREEERPLARLAATGRLERATGDWLEMGPALQPAPDAPLPSQLLAETRADER
jgi:prevent-host-death family protein